MCRFLAAEWSIKMKNNKGMGTVEIILIIVVLIGLVLIFKTQITELAKTIFDKITADSSDVLACATVIL